MKFKPAPHQLLLGAQITAHLAVIPMVLFARTPDYLISLAVYFFTGCIGMNMTYHRLLSHRSWRAPRWFEKAGTVLGSLGLTGSPLAWCAVHREHHMHAETAKDPHSPHFKTWWQVQYFSMRHPPQIRVVLDLLRDPFQRFVHRHYFKISFSYALILFLVDPFLVVSAFLFPAAVLWNAGSAVNSFGHLFGYRNHATHDESRNNLILGYFVWGEGWHNNHHRSPKKFYFGERWFEIDLSGLLIYIFKRPKKTSAPEDAALI